MTTQEAAEALGVTLRRVQAMIKAGRLQAEKRGRDYWIEPKAIDEARVRKAGRPAGWRKAGGA